MEGAALVWRDQQRRREFAVVQASKESPWRDTRAGAGWNVVSIAAFLTMVGVVVGGTWWTISAYWAGDTAGTLLRFCLASLLGAYYLVLYRTSKVQPRR